jgi:hypothetical protein
MESDAQLIIELSPDASFAPFAKRIGDDLYYIGLDSAPGSPALKLSRQQIIRLMATIMADLMDEHWVAS